MVRVYRLELGMDNGTMVKWLRERVTCWRERHEKATVQGDPVGRLIARCYIDAYQDAREQIDPEGIYLRLSSGEAEEVRELIGGTR